MYTPIFAISRTSDWLAHIFGQFTNNRLIRPHADCLGPDERHVEASDKRG